MHNPAPQEYGRYQQHAALLNDAIRVGAYNLAISESKPRKIVLDIGGGTGILSLLALRHGYQSAIVIEPSRKMSRYATELLNSNGFAGRFSIISDSFENIAPSFLPRPDEVDLLVTETISSLGVGFGCWPAFMKFASLMRSEAAVIPGNLTVYAGYVCENLSHSLDGIERIKELGIKIDLEEKTFWSGGNVSDKNRVSLLIDDGLLVAKPVLTVKPQTESTVTFFEANFDQAHSFAGNIVGILAYFEAQLVPAEPLTFLNSLDPQLASWCPIYVPIPEIYRRQNSNYPRLSLKTEPGDEPYPFCFRFYCGEAPVSHRLLW